MRIGSRLKEKINCEITLLMDCDWGGSCVSYIVNCQRSYGEHELVPTSDKIGSERQTMSTSHVLGLS